LFRIGDFYFKFSSVGLDEPESDKITLVRRMRVTFVR